MRRHGAWVTIRGEAVDDGGPGPATGIHEFGVYLTGGLATPTMVQQADSSWVGRVFVPRGAKPGTHAVDSVRLRDGAVREFGHVLDYSRERLAAMGLAATFQVVSTADRRAPRLQWLRMSSTSVDLTGGPAHVRVRARVTDDLAGTANVHLEVGVGIANLTLRRGSRRDGVWAGTLTFPRWSETVNSPYQVYVGLQDQAGNDRSVYSDKLRDRGLPSMLTVTSRRIDRDDPQITALTASPTAVDLTAGSRPVTVTVHARDQVSGVVAPKLLFLKTMRRIAGDRHRGVWRATATLDACFTGTREMRVPVSVSDRAGNRTRAVTVVSVVNHNDIRPPAPRMVTPELAGPTEPVTFAFTEDVVGISSASAPVRPAYPGSGFGFGDPPASVPGNWACSSAAGAAVDCGSGPLRRATWTPAAPLTPGAAHRRRLRPRAHPGRQGPFRKPARPLLAPRGRVRAHLADQGVTRRRGAPRASAPARRSWLISTALFSRRRLRCWPDFTALGPTAQSVRLPDGRALGDASHNPSQPLPDCRKACPPDLSPHR